MVAVVSGTLFLARHGETMWHAENRYAGVSDIALTALGRQQAERLGKWASGARLDGVWCSPLSRARDTAEPASRVLGLPLNVEPDLRELDFGIAEGLTMAELRIRHPDAARAFEANPVAGHFPKGDPPEQAAERAATALRRIAAQQPRALVVAHNTLMRLAICQLFQIPLADYRRVFPGLRNGAVTELRFQDTGSVGLIGYNNPA